MDVVRELGLPFGVVINRAEKEDALVRPYLEAEKIPLLATIPDDRRIAETYAKGQTIIDALPEYEDHFTTLLQKIRGAA